MNRMTKNLVAASILGVLITLPTLLYKTVAFAEVSLHPGAIYYYYGFPFHIYKETFMDSFVGPFYYQFFVLYAVVDTFCASSGFQSRS